MRARCGVWRECHEIRPHPDFLCHFSAGSGWRDVSCMPHSFVSHWLTPPPSNVVDADSKGVASLHCCEFRIRARLLARNLDPPPSRGRQDDCRVPQRDFLIPKFMECLKNCLGTWEHCILHRVLGAVCGNGNEQMKQKQSPGKQWQILSNKEPCRPNNWGGPCMSSLLT